MSKASKEIECIAKLDELIAVYDSLLDFMQEEDLISKDERRGCLQNQDRAKWLWTKLAVLSKTNKLQLLEYFWQVLPTELIQITIVTDRAKKEFSFGY